MKKDIKSEAAVELLSGWPFFIYSKGVSDTEMDVRI